MDPRLREAVVHHQQGRLDEAGALYAAILEQRPDHFDALHLAGVVAAQQGRPGEAVRLITRAIGIKPNDAVAQDNLANALRQLGDLGGALRGHDRAIALDPKLPEPHANRGTTLHEQGRDAEAVASFDEALRLRPAYPEALNNRGNALSTLGDLAGALASYREAIRHKPGYAEAHYNMGATLAQRSRDAASQAEAVRCYDRAIALRPDYPEALANRALTLTELRDYAGALASYEAALALRPGYDFLRGMCMHARMHLAQWDGFEQDVAEVSRAAMRGEKVSPPFPLLSLADSPSLHRQVAATMQAAKYASSAGARPRSARASGDRLRVGFFSSDFRTHPVAAVAVGMFERLDRSRFETFAFSFSSRPGDPLRPRIEAAFDRFIDVQQMTDAEVAALSRDLGIHIAIDLMGYTAGNRTGIFAQRAAPVQVNFLGFPGTMAAPYIDYLIVDRTVVPPGMEQEYTEKLVFLPDTCMPTDPGRPLPQAAPTRGSMGLPARGFVFCSFNNTYKITPEVFAAWMRILAQVPGSVLWLMHDSAAPADNLRRRAQDAGIDPARLVFAARMPSPEDHLARHRVADLFLDTLPFNAHSTAVDALWAGLPVLTRCGNAFAGRVAASLLRAVGLPELVTSSLGDYEARAVELASNPSMIIAVRRKLEANRPSAPLFDTARFTRHIEAALHAMHDRERAGLEPDHIHVASLGVARAPTGITELLAQARAHHKEGRLQEALAAYEQVKQAQPDHFEAWHLCGVIQGNVGDMAASAASISRAIELRPGDAGAHNNLGNALHALKRNDEAIASYRRAIELEPDNATARNNLANALHDARRYVEALASYDEVVRARPDWATAWLRRGTTLASLGRFADALECFAKTRALLKAQGREADTAPLLNNHGNAQTALGLHDAALASYEQALALQPEDAQTHWNKALLLLQMGDLARGWPEFEWRWKHESLKLRKRDFSQPLWTGGETVRGRTVLLHCEQGFGDSIQFCRYAAMVTELGARVVLETPAALLPLFKSLHPQPELVVQGKPLPDFDLHCPLMSLPLAFDTHLRNVPAQERYLAADPAAVQRWAQRLPAGIARKKVGFAWSGRPTHANDANRSISFADVRGLLPHSIDPVCLQKELREADVAEMQRDGRVRSFASDLRDFGDTAALCENLDLVISVDTSVAHLAAALGRPVWILLPFNADWRWMRDRDDSPWYPTVRLFRQTQPGSWVEALEAVRIALGKWAESHVTSG